MPQTPRQHVADKKEVQLSEDVRFLLVVLLLFVFYPVGLILMWAWTSWPTWLKLLISLPVLLGIFLFFMVMTLFLGALHHGMSMNRQNRPAIRQNYRGYMMQPMMQQAPIELQQTTIPTPAGSY